MKRRFEYGERLRLEAGESPLAQRLRVQGLIKSVLLNTRMRMSIEELHVYI
ncbi:MAG: hypothetical protein DSM106950_06820 [Stigonema ocellatum SAG 48.90 = DSM 106950]|nr:hypothetical protein [Stigonema ocellatum SAG 48.90 = DSM 106950]